MHTRRLPLIAAAFAAASLLAGPAGADDDAGPKIVRQGEAASGYIVVTADKADIFAAPADDAASIGSVAKGDAFPLAGRQEGWYFVATGAATHGWIRSTAAATVFYPEYFAPRPAPDYSSPPAASPPYPYPPYPGPWMHRGYGPGWRDRDDPNPAWGGLRMGVWMNRQRDRWDDDRDRDRWDRDRHRDWGWGWDRDRGRDRWRDRD